MIIASNAIAPMVILKVEVDGSKILAIGEGSGLCGGVADGVEAVTTIQSIKIIKGIRMKNQRLLFELKINRFSLKSIRLITVAN